jgi:hypothetical protein
MSNKILHKRSSTPGSKPTTASLDLGELAQNTADGTLFLKKDDGTPSIQQILVTDSSTQGNLQLSGSLLISGSGGDTVLVQNVNVMELTGSFKVLGDLEVSGDILVNNSSLGIRGVHSVVSSSNLFNFWPEGLGELGGYVSLYGNVFNANQFPTWSASSEFNFLDKVIVDQDNVFIATPNILRIPSSSQTIDWETAGNLGYVKVNGNSWTKVGTYISGGWQPETRYKIGDHIIVEVDNVEYMYHSEQFFTSDTTQPAGFDGDDFVTDVEINVWKYNKDFAFYSGSTSVELDVDVNNLGGVTFNPVLVDPYNNVWWSNSWLYGTLTSSTDSQQVCDSCIDGDIRWFSKYSLSSNGNGFLSLDIVLPLNKPHGSRITFSDSPGYNLFNIQAHNQLLRGEQTRITWANNLDSVTLFYNAYYGFWVIENT